MIPETKITELPKGLGPLTVADVRLHEGKIKNLFHRFCSDMRDTIIETTSPLANKIIDKAKERDEAVVELLLIETVGMFGYSGLRIPLVNAVVAMAVENAAYPGQQDFDDEYIIDEAFEKDKERRMKDLCVRANAILKGYASFQFLGIYGPNELGLDKNLIGIEASINTGKLLPD